MKSKDSTKLSNVMKNRQNWGRWREKQMNDLTINHERGQRA